MLKILLLLIVSCFCSFVYAQTDTLTFSKEEMRMLDSMFKNDEFIKLMMGKDKSFFDLNVMMSNGIFSFDNNALNAGQARTNKIYYTSSVSYNYKSGLGISISSSFATDEGNTKIYQYAISPSYSFKNKNFDIGISYTRYIKGSATQFQINPFKNDLYASVVYKKKWIEPGLALGYSFGKQVEYYDTAFWLLNRIVHLRDTITTKLGSISIALSASHQWGFNNLLNKKDAMQIRTSLILNTGSQKWNISHSNSLVNRRPVVQNFVKSRYGDGTTSTAFNIQSAAFSANLIYYYGKFYLQPQIYLDYYLPSTTEKKLTTLFSITLGVSF